MEILQEIGSYAGLAAVLGLAVLSALYFSQARDVKRLREWAGRAPERAPETTGAQPRVAAKPVPRAPGQAAAATQAGAPAAPGAKPVPPAPAGARAAAAAAGAAPATAVGPAAATPAARAEAAKAGEEADEDEAATGGDNGTDDTSALSQDTVVHPPPPPPGEDDDEYDDDEDDFDDTGDHDQVSEEDDALDDDGDWEDTGEHDVPTPRSTGRTPATSPRVTAAPRHAGGVAADPAGRPRARRRYAHAGAAASPSTETGSGGGGSILPPYAHSRPGGRASEANGGGGRRVFASRGRGIAVVAAGILLLGGIALGATQLLGGDDEPASSSGGQDSAQDAPQTETSADRPARRQRPNPRNVRVAVLNGTTVPGLAAQIGDQIERQGFRLGTVTNFNDQQRAESVVLYAPGAEREAAEVGRRLKIAQREPIDAESQGVAGDATCRGRHGPGQDPVGAKKWHPGHFLNVNGPTAGGPLLVRRGHLAEQRLVHQADRRPRHLDRRAVVGRVPERP